MVNYGSEQIVSGNPDYTLVKRAAGYSLFDGKKDIIFQTRVGDSVTIYRISHEHLARVASDARFIPSVDGALINADGTTKSEKLSDPRLARDLGKLVNKLLQN
ncbi:MAG TPA: hypothetical protein VJI68_01860 [Candidatus Nanoarchaeia archaeon]|nr:hypothetical protein [Candidatus Nanoarchaeia archaeon]